jgi:hypothetical protein
LLSSDVPGPVDDIGGNNGLNSSVVLATLFALEKKGVRPAATGQTLTARCFPSLEPPLQAYILAGILLYASGAHPHDAVRKGKGSVSQKLAESKGFNEAGNGPLKHSGRFVHLPLR